MQSSGADTAVQLASALRRLGGFFPAQVHRLGELAAAPWQPLRTLLDDTDRLASRVESVGRSLGTAGGSDRVAASVAHLGIVARLLAPTMAGSALGFGPTSLEPDELWWQGELSGAFALSIAVLPSRTAAEQRLGGTVVELTEQIRNRYRVPARTLWGNVGSAANTAAQLLANAQPTHAAAACVVAQGILSDHRVDGGRLQAGPSFRRRSCCLIYQAPGRRSALCQDCVLLH